MMRLRLQMYYYHCKLNLGSKMRDDALLGTIREAASARLSTVGLTGQGSGVDPDLSLNLVYRCGGELNYNGYCSPEVDKLIARQSIEPDAQKRKKLVWGIERKLAEDSARPIIFYDRRATCRQPYVKGRTTMVNSIFNGWRIEDVWVDK